MSVVDGKRIRPVTQQTPSKHYDLERPGSLSTHPKTPRTMKSLLYSLLPYWAIASIRRRRDIKRRYKLAVRDNGRIYGTYIDPI
jgi:hypothetical protein